MPLKWDTQLKEQDGQYVGTITMTLRVMVQKDPEEDRYFALTPDLPGCATVGDTPEQAADNMRITIEEWLIKDNCG